MRRGYFLTTPEDYGTAVESVGFASVSAADTTDSLTVRTWGPFGTPALPYSSTREQLPPSLWNNRPPF